MTEELTTKGTKDTKEDAHRGDAEGAESHIVLRPSRKLLHPDHLRAVEACDGYQGGLRPGLLRELQMIRIDLRASLKQALDIVQGMDEAIAEVAHLSQGPLASGRAAEVVEEFKKCETTLLATDPELEEALIRDRIENGQSLRNIYKSSGENCDD